MRKRKKLFTRLTLCVLLVAMLIPMFSVFSSAAGNSDIPYSNLLPQYVYEFSNIGDPNIRRTAYWKLDRLDSGESICFGLMNSTGDAPWHIFPYVRGSQGASEVIEYYNNGNLSGEANFGLISPLVNSSIFNSLISYGTSTDEYLIILTFKDSVLQSWTKPWKPMYVIKSYFINQTDTDATPLPIATQTSTSIFNQGIFASGLITTYTYPQFDVATALRSFDFYERAGLRFVIEEYFYDVATPYPTTPSSFANNLYTFNGVEGHFVSFPFRYWFNSYDSEYQKGFNAGKNEGFTDGYREGIKISENYNAVDGIVTLAQVPGALVSSMLDFNFFGINLANFVKFVFTLIIIAFILVVFFKFLL